jgi:Ca2+-transporting ATPase
MNYSILFSFALVMAVVYIPFVQPIFKTTALSWLDWAIIGGLALIPFVTGELVKGVINIRKKRVSGK